MSTGAVKYLLTTVDVFSKYVGMYPIKKGKHGDRNQKDMR